MAIRVLKGICDAAGLWETRVSSEEMLTFRTKYSASPLHRHGTVTIVLSQYSLDRDRDLCLTHECKTIEEVRAEIERLKKELDAVVAQAADRLTS